MRQASKSKMAFTCLKQKNKMSQPYLILLVAQQDLTISLSICDFPEMSQTSLNFHDIHSQGFCISLYFMLDQMFSTKCRKKTSLAKYYVLLSVDSFFPRNMELFPGVTLQLHTTVIHAFFNKEISFFTWSLPCFFLCSCCYTKQCSRNSNFD